MNRPAQLPLYIAVIAANLLPVYGVMVGKLVFFQVIYLYWFESLLLIAFDCLRIATAQGTDLEDSWGAKIKGLVLSRSLEYDLTFAGKCSLIIKTIVIRVIILLFYLLFIVVFVGFQITQKGQRSTIFSTMAFRNPFFNTAVLLFLISMSVQLIGGFFISGKYRTSAPINHTDIFTARTFLMHIMIVGSAVIHQFFFQGKTYVGVGEILYVAIFMLFRTLLDIHHIRGQQKEAAAIPMI